MCQFNFIILENNKNEAKIRELAYSSNLNLTPVKLNIPNYNFHSYSTCKKDCDCGSIIGNDIWKEENFFDEDRERKRLARKRFSSNRIDQLLKQKKEDFDSTNEKQDTSEFNEGQNWVDFFDKIKSLKLEERAGILFHNFSGSIQDEKLKLKEATLDEISNSCLKKINEDEISWIILNASR